LSRPGFFLEGLQPFLVQYNAYVQDEGENYVEAELVEGDRER
jgi:hypothetical protein